MSFAKTVASGAPAGYPRTLLHTQFQNQYQPRSGTFDIHQKASEAQSNQMYMNGRGHIRHYGNNGGGRDSYIYRDDGGFTKMYDPVKWANVGSIQGKPLHKKAPPNPVMHAKPVFYRANGGGRDSYIETTSGGQFNTLNHSYEYRDNFKKSLRSYEKLPIKNKAQRPVFSAMHGQRLTLYNGREDQQVFGSSMSLPNQNKSRQDVQRVFSSNKKITGDILSKLQNGGRNHAVNKSQAAPLQDSVFGAQQAMRNTFVTKSLANPLAGNISYAENPEKDIYLENQKTFPRSFVSTQTRLSAYQNGLDQRLSQPKHIRRRIIGSGYQPQIKEQKLRTQFHLSQERDRQYSNQLRNAESALNLLDDNDIAVENKNGVNNTVV